MNQLTLGLIALGGIWLLKKNEAPKWTYYVWIGGCLYLAFKDGMGRTAIVGKDGRIQYMGNPKRTRPDLWEKAKKKATKKLGGHSARAMQLAVKYYKDMGGDYIGEKDEDNSLAQWTDENWQDCGGKDGRYLPKAVCDLLTPEQRKETARNKRKGGGEGSWVDWEPYIQDAFKEARRKGLIAS